MEFRVLGVQAIGGRGLKGPLRPVHRIAVPIKGLIQRFAYVGLVAAAFGLMLLGKADVLLVERIRTQVTDALAPILDVLSRPIATVSDVVDQVRELASLREENAGLREDKARLLQWQMVARRLEAENTALRALARLRARARGQLRHRPRHRRHRRRLRPCVGAQCRFSRRRAQGTGGGHR